MNVECQPLDENEQRRVYLAQIHLGAVKPCLTCGTVKPVADFANYGRRVCWDCASRPSRWFGDRIR